MADHAPVLVDDDLRADLAAYLEATATVEMPAGVRSMSAARLTARRRPWTAGLLRPALGLAAVAAVILVGFGAWEGAHGAGGAGSSAKTSTTALAPAARGPVAGGSSGADQQGQPVPTQAIAAPLAGALIDYPGVDPGLVRSSMNITLQSPGPAGPATIPAASAQAVAAAAGGGGGVAVAGPAVLALASFPGLPAPNSCLCWVVHVTPPPGTAGTAVLVLVDARTGDLFARLTGPGIA